MLCQNCQHNDADKVFVANWMGTQYQMHICDECLQKMWQHAAATGFGDSFRAMSGWWPGKENPRANGEPPFPQNADIDMKIRRQLGALRYRLQEAARREDYEEAARLRDSIARIEQGEYSHEA